MKRNPHTTRSLDHGSKLHCFIYGF